MAGVSAFDSLVDARGLGSGLLLVPGAGPGSTVVDGLLMLQGYENGKAWNMVIGTQTGRWGGSIVEDDGSFAVFGACTLP